MADHRERDEQRQAEIKISDRISRIFLGLVVGLSALAGMAYVLLPGSGPVQPVPGAAAQTITVAMHDPGCHWFQVGRGFQRSLAVNGPVRLLNSDEAPLSVAGSNGVRTDAVGRRVALSPGSYRITMVGQAPDDNTLHLAVN
jgi:hypothetical protein